MNLTGVQPGDIVRVDGSYGTVRAKEKGRILVRWLKATNEQWAKAREVEAHWRQTKQRPRRTNAEAA